MLIWQDSEAFGRNVRTVSAAAKPNGSSVGDIACRKFDEWLTGLCEEHVLIATKSQRQPVLGWEFEEELCVALALAYEQYAKERPHTLNIVEISEQVRTRFLWNGGKGRELLAEHQQALTAASKMFEAITPDKRRQRVYALEAVLLFVKLAQEEGDPRLLDAIGLVLEVLK